MTLQIFRDSLLQLVSQFHFTTVLALLFIDLSYSQQQFLYGCDDLHTVHRPLESQYFHFHQCRLLFYMNCLIYISAAISGPLVAFLESRTTFMSHQQKNKKGVITLIICSIGYSPQFSVTPEPTIWMFIPTQQKIPHIFQ